MKKLKVLILAFAFVFFGVSGASAQTTTIDLYQWIFNVNSTVYDSFGIDGSSTLPSNFSTAAFDPITGLGSITATFNSSGNYNFIGFFDHEIDQLINGFSNEFGTTSIGSPVAGQSFETGEPGFITPPPNIYTRTLSGALGNLNGAGPDDVSMALGWNFALASGETGIITLNLSTTTIPGGFYLQQTDPDSQASIYYSGALNIQGGGPAPIPEPGTMFLLGSGLAGLIGFGRKRLFRK